MDQNSNSSIIRIFIFIKNFSNILGDCLTSVVVPSYAYTYIRTSFLKKLLIDEEQLKKLKSYNRIEDFINFIKPFYPDLDFSKYTIEKIELALYDFFIRVNGKIIS
ncbi:MAG: hypothetical protein ACFFAO_20410, partial [Candidatus Hermodarchaeota archaeon]